MNNKHYFLKLLSLFPTMGIVLSIGILLNGCAGTVVSEEDPIPQLAEAAPEWSALFHNDKGWFGGDGVFAIPLDGKEFVPATEQTKTLFIFSDSVIGELKDGKVSGREDFAFVNNVVAILKGNKPVKDSFEFIWAKDEKGNPSSMFKPNTSATRPGDYYWLGDGFVNIDADSTLYIFAYRIEDVDPAEGFFTFRQVSVNLLAIPKGEEPPFKNVRQMETPFFFPFQGNTRHMATFGNGIMVNTQSAGAPDPDGYIYIMGSAGPDISMLLARVKPADFEQFDAWRFWNGSEWVSDFREVKGVISGVSNEMSMSPLGKGRYIAGFQLFGMTNEVAIQVGTSPTGPFFPHRKVWYCREVDEDMDYFSYNAKGYPHLSKPGTLLMSYNINSFDFWEDIKTDPTHCRPRFIHVKIH
jgi:hypothetical protein